MKFSDFLKNQTGLFWMQSTQTVAFCRIYKIHCSKCNICTHFSTPAMYTSVTPKTIQKYIYVVFLNSGPYLLFKDVKMFQITVLSIEMKPYSFFLFSIFLRKISDWVYHRGFQILDNRCLSKRFYIGMSRNGYILFLLAYVPQSSVLII